MQLLKYCQAFRAAIDACDKSKLSIPFAAFPRGACGDSSILLARYLKESGMGNFDYVSGWRNGASHAWLEQGETIIDITGDQFEDGPGTVYVGRKTCFYSSFDRESRHKADADYDEQMMVALDACYQEIVSYFSKISRG